MRKMGAGAQPVVQRSLKAFSGSSPPRSLEGGCGLLRPGSSPWPSKPCLSGGTLLARKLGFCCPGFGGCGKGFMLGCWLCR